MRNSRKSFDEISKGMDNARISAARFSAVLKKAQTSLDVNKGILKEIERSLQEDFGIKSEDQIMVRVQELQQKKEEMEHEMAFLVKELESNYEWD